MKILKLKASRIKNRINILFEDGSYLPLFIDDVIKKNLKIGDNIEIDDLKKLSTEYLVREYALRQIAISPKTQKILFQKIKRKFKEFNPDSIITALSPYLDDQKYIDYILKKFKQKSNREISYRLKLAGISYNCHQDEKEKIETILKKKKNISISALIGRGFAYDDIKSVFAKLGILR